ncbi:transposable element P transposase [Trichonephila clavipes]|nr:transposable element P transposase [Trichonephila clavipes]
MRRYTEAYNEKTGEKICVPSKRYRLQNFAVPTIFTDFPTYLSNSGNPTPECLEKRLQTLENEHLQRSLQASIISKEEFEKKKSFTSFPELVECLNAEKLQDIWTVICKSDRVIIMMLDTKISLVIKASVIINKDLDLTIHIGQTKIDQLVNVKTPLKEQHLLDPYQQPITLSPGNQTCEFLHKILSWLDSWKGKNCTTGTLTKETHFAFIHTTYALLEMSKYCINDLKFQYFLPGKIQTDALESRFGKYRTLSGSQYLISIRQLYEVEAKLRMQNFLPLTLVSNTYGHLNLKDIHLEGSCNENPLESSVLHNFNLTLSEKDFRDAEPYLPVLTYLAGVCARAALKKLKCDFCSKSLVLNKSFELNFNYDLIRNLDRGSLLCPSPDVVTAVLYNYIIVQKLLSNDYENMFLKQNNQRQIASEISISLINSNEFFI